MKYFLGVVLVVILIGWVPAAHSQHNEDADNWQDFSVVENASPVPADRLDGFNSIRGEEAASYLRFLASDLLQGRETATDGFDIAAEFVATFFRIWGIKPAGDLKGLKQERSYFQEIQMKETLSSKSTLTVRYSGPSISRTRSFYQDVDYSYYSSGNWSLAAPVVFVGYGISEKKLRYDDYLGVDIKGKIVIMFSEFPGVNDPKSRFNKTEFKEKYLPRRRSHQLSPKISLAKEKGALAVLLVENSPEKKGDVAKKVIDSRKINDEKPVFSRARKRLSLIGSSKPMPWEALPYVRISREMAGSIMEFGQLKLEQLKTEIDKTGKPRSRELPGVSVRLENQAEIRLVRSRNVLGFIKGSDPNLGNEVVVIGAHLDHLGRKGDYIFNGADDNGSGSVAVMEIAEAFARNRIQPKRSVLFALWTGEETGLIGSRYYVLNPFFPISKTIACLNLDMVSRTWTLNRLKRINRLWRLGISEAVMKKINMDRFVSLIIDGNSPLIDQTIQVCNRYMGLTIYNRKSKGMGMGSDHAPFARLKIPWIFCLVAPTEDYHEPSDSLEKVNFNLIEKYSRLTYLMSFELANQ
jgi:hypothetical protein